MKNKTSTDVFVQVENSTKTEINEQEFELCGKEKNVIYAFPGNDYVAHIYDMTDVNPSSDIAFSSTSLPIEINKKNISKQAALNKKELFLEMRALHTQKGVTARIQKQLDMYSKLSGKSVSNVKMYRGAYLELYLAMLLKKLKTKKIIDDYESSVNLGAYNIPHPVPLKPDFVITVGNINVVLEITLMRTAKTKISKEMKLEIEGAIRHMQEQMNKIDIPTGKDSRGLFVAGSINSLVTDELANWARTYGVKKYKALDIEELLLLLEKENRTEIEKYIV